MVKPIALLVASLAVVLAAGCSAEAGDLPGDEEVGAEGEALTYAGYCLVSPSTHLLTGKCGAGSGLCQQAASTACPAGAAAITYAVSPSVCSSTGYYSEDLGRKCSVTK